MKAFPGFADQVICLLSLIYMYIIWSIYIYIWMNFSQSVDDLFLFVNFMHCEAKF